MYMSMENGVRESGESIDPEEIDVRLQWCNKGKAAI